MGTLRRRRGRRSTVAEPARPRRRVTARRAVVAVCLTVLVVAGAWLWVVASRVGRITHQSPLSVVHDIVAGGGGSSVGSAAHDQQRIVIALYGYGGSGHEGSSLTDSIMLVVIQPHASRQAQIAEVSVPRDWNVPIDLGKGDSPVWSKINAAYAFAAQDIYPNRADQYKGEFGGAHLADDTLQHVLGVHVDHFIGIDFHAFQYAVDAVGGIDVNVLHSFTDYQYPRGECNPGGGGDCSYETVHFDAGPQHLDGARALILVRSRHSGDNGEGSDFARSRRQQLVISAVKEKVAGIGGISRLPQMLDALAGHVVTDMSAGDAEALYALVKDVDATKVEHVSIDDTNFLYDCGYPASCDSWYLSAYDPTYRALSHFLAGVIPDAAALAERVPVTVLNGSGNAGASARWAGVLSQLGFDAHDGGSQTPLSTTQISTGGAVRGTKTAGWLERFFSASSVVPAAAVGTPATAPDGVTLVLGSDEEQAFGAGGTGVPGSARTGGSSSAAGLAAPPVAATSSAATQVAPAPVPTSRPVPTHTATPAPTAIPVVTPGPTASPRPTRRPTPTSTPTPPPH